MTFFSIFQTKKQQNTSPQSGDKPPVKNTQEEVAHSLNGVEPESNPIPSLLSGDMSLDDPSLSDGQRDVVIKYLKHVVLTFLSCGQSEVRVSFCVIVFSFFFFLVPYEKTN